MKSFLEEYGVAIFVVLCIVLLIAIATPVGTAIKTAVTELVEAFTNKGKSAVAGM